MALIQVEESALESLKRMVEELEKDAARFQFIAANVESDGYGYWLPEWCVGEAAPMRPALDEIRAAIDTKQ